MNRPTRKAGRVTLIRNTLLRYNPGYSMYGIHYTDEEIRHIAQRLKNEVVDVIQTDK